MLANSNWLSTTSRNVANSNTTGALQGLSGQQLVRPPSSRQSRLRRPRNLGFVVAEESTVDLAAELTSMAEAQSSYEADSKVFQTGADILDIPNNLKASVIE